jgi:hypothetical protein
MVLIFFILLFAAIFIISLLVYAIKSFVIAFLDAWKNYNPDAINNDTSEIESDIDQNILDELEHLKQLKRGYTELYSELESGLEYATDKQKIIIKRQLLTLDNKTFTLDKKINKLLEKLE